MTDSVLKIQLDLTQVQGQALEIIQCLSASVELLRYAQNEGNTPIFLQRSMKLIERIKALGELPCSTESSQ